MRNKKFSPCKLPPQRTRVLPADIDPRRARMIQLLASKWVNGTTLRFYFFTSADGRAEWVAKNEAQHECVRKAFRQWKALGLGLEFIEVARRQDADIRIGFDLSDGSWSYIGREIREQPADDRTMNFGWDIADDIDTALHEIGHTLGFPHEHQNPNAGIVWNEEAVYDALAEPPNGWDRETTFYNILRKLESGSIRGSTWDPNSVMHYPFEPGLIKKPERFSTGLTPAGGLSDLDVQYARQFYPTIANTPQQLTPFVSSQLQLGAGEQADFVFEPSATRTYTIQTFGESDTVMVLFEGEGAEQRQLAGDDDSGTERNASLEIKLVAGRRYTLRVRLYVVFQHAQTAVMVW
jgi:hypothetical protein